MQTQNYNRLIGMDKKGIIDELGSEFNYYHSEIWTYHIKTNWLGEKTYLLILFKNEKVHQIKIKKTYAKLGY